MKELLQARDFYRKLSEDEKKELEKTLADNIFFIDSEVYLKVIELLKKVDLELGKNVEERNCFTR